MRSKKVFHALQSQRNRYILCLLASQATRKFHRPNTRIPDTMNEVLDRLASSAPKEGLIGAEAVDRTQRRAA